MGGTGRLSQLVSCSRAKPKKKLKCGQSFDASNRAPPPTGRGEYSEDLLNMNTAAQRIDSNVVVHAQMTTLVPFTISSLSRPHSANRTQNQNQNHF